MHRIHQLYQQRKQASTKPFNARGKGVDRCSLCLVAKHNCICEWRKATKSRAAFLIIYHDKEVLKPSSTGKIIADIIPETYGVIWQRTEPNPLVTKLLANEDYYPIIVFPHSFAKPEQQKVHQLGHSLIPNKKQPLFIMIDASWREARRIFNKSPYLQNIPMFSLSNESLSNLKQVNAYNIRKVDNSAHFSTAEIASQVLLSLGERRNSQLLHQWLSVFNYFYQESVCQENKGDSSALEQYIQLLKT